MINPIKKLRAYVRLKRAISKANEQFELTHKRQYVLIYDGKLIVTGRADLKRWKRKKLVPWNVTVQTMERMCIYHTPHGNGSMAMGYAEGKIRKALYYKSVL